MIKDTKKFPKMLLFYYNLGFTIQPSVAKVRENRNYKLLYLGTMILFLKTY